MNNTQMNSCICCDSEVWNQLTFHYPIRPDELRKHTIQITTPHLRCNRYQENNYIISQGQLVTKKHVGYSVFQKVFILYMFITAEKYDKSNSEHMKVQEFRNSNSFHIMHYICFTSLISVQSKKQNDFEPTALEDEKGKSWNEDCLQ